MQNEKIEASIKKIIADLTDETELKENPETEIDIASLTKIFIPVIISMLKKDVISLEDIQIADVVRYKIRDLEEAVLNLEDWEEKERKKEVIIALKRIHKSLKQISK